MASRVFYREINDYIQDTKSKVSTVVMFVKMMNHANGSHNVVSLQFNNVDAVLWGFDADWSYQLSDVWSLNGLVNIIRGKRGDINDDLYRISPDNASMVVAYN